MLKSSSLFLQTLTGKEIEIDIEPTDKVANFRHCLQGGGGGGGALCICVSFLFL